MWNGMLRERHVEGSSVFRADKQSRSRRQLLGSHGVWGAEAVLGARRCVWGEAVCGEAMCVTCTKCSNVRSSWLERYMPAIATAGCSGTGVESSERLEWLRTAVGVG